MIKELKNENIDAAIKDCGKIGVVLDYVVLINEDSSTDSHDPRDIALFGMKMIDQKLEEWAYQYSSNEFPLVNFFRVKLCNIEPEGKKIILSDFWGNDDALPKRTSYGGSSIPDVNGYKTAFFNPLHGLHTGYEDQESIFNRINSLLLEPISDDNLEIYSWSTDWSNYFDSGNEWWGSYYWTIFNKNKNFYIVIGASTTD